jgi:hypothetical protein
MPLLLALVWRHCSFRREIYTLRRHVLASRNVPLQRVRVCAPAACCGVFAIVGTTAALSA